MKYNNEYGYFITFIFGKFNLLFSNIVNDNKDIFYFSEIDLCHSWNYVPKILKLTPNAYIVKDINFSI